MFGYWRCGMDWGWVLLGTVFLTFLVWMIVSLARGRHVSICRMGNHAHLN